LGSRSSGALADLADAFRGVTVTIVTPFHARSLDIDLAGLRQNARLLAGAGLSVIVPAGNTGEYHSLTVEEIRALASATVQEVGGRAAVAVGVGGDQRTAIALAQDMQRAGAAGILLHEPTHTFVTDEGLYRYYLDICRAVDIGVAIYKRSPRLPDEVIVRIARECTNVVAIKYAWNDVASYVRLAAEAPSGITCACGSAERWALPFSAAGTTGFTSGIANFAPDLALDYWRAMQADAPQARDMWRQFSRIEELRAGKDAAFNVPVVKHAMALVGLPAGPVRPPLSEVSTDMGNAIRRILDDWGIDGRLARTSTTSATRLVASNLHDHSR
jgi:4-hydroxy-tetrahydrodipicolinate synthase